MANETKSASGDNTNVYVQSYHGTAGGITHVYGWDHLIYRWHRPSRYGGTVHTKEPRPRMLCGSLIMCPRYLTRPLGVMCSRCEQALSDNKLPARAREPIEVVLSEDDMQQNAKTLAYLKKMRTPLP